MINDKQPARILFLVPKLQFQNQIRSVPKLEFGNQVKMEFGNQMKGIHKSLVPKLQFRNRMKRIYARHINMKFPILLTGILAGLFFHASSNRAADPPAAGNKPPAAKEAPAPPADPSAAAVIESKPGTPLECLRAAKVLAEADRPDLAKPFLKKVLDTKLDRAELARLAKEVGSATLTVIGQRKDLQPEGKQVADAFLDALSTELQEPGRIAALIAQLQDPAVEKRDAAVTGLVQARGAAIRTILAALDDPKQEANFSRLRAVLPLMDRDAFRPLVGVLENADPALRVQVILSLQALGDTQAKLFLLEPALAPASDQAVRAAAQNALRQLAGGVPDRDEAVRLLTDAAENYFDRREKVADETGGKVELWQWDADKKQCRVLELPGEDAARAVAARLAGDAFRLAPDDPNVRRLHLMTLLDAAAYRKGLDQPLDEGDASIRIASGLGTKALEEVLAAALATHHPGAAAAAAQLLGRIGKAEQLYQSATPCPLARAVQSPDRRVRLAALKSLAAWKPDRPYPGSSAVPDALAFFIATRGGRQALVAGPNSQDNQRLVGSLAAAGYQAGLAVNGREAMRLLTGSPDYELALIDAGIDRPLIEQLLQEIRRDCRTADLRVGVLAREGFSDRAERAAEADTSAKAFVRPHDEQAVRWQIDQLAALNPRDFVGHDERQRQAAEAMDLMAEMARSGGKIYDFRRALPAVLTAMNSPALAAKAIAVLGKLNLPEAQRTLAETASRGTAALEVRQAALAALRENIKAHGILLTNREIRRQYDRYNQSAQADRQTQKILGEILDILESPKKSK
jgi:hypothetical protein